MFSQKHKENMETYPNLDSSIVDSLVGGGGTCQDSARSDCGARLECH